MVKVSAYAALALHTDYAVEPGAHAGSQMERLSVDGAKQMIRATRPTGLKTALRYAREAYSAAVTEVDAMVFAAMRAYVLEVGVENIPRSDSWRAVAAWATKRAQRAD